MKRIIKKIKNNKVLYFLGVLIIGVLLVLVGRITYAYLAPEIINAQGNVTINSGTVDDFKLSVGSPLKLDATPTTLPENGANAISKTTATASLKANSTKNTASYNYYVYIEILNNTLVYSDGSTPEVILSITDPTGAEVTNINGLTYGTYSGISGFDITTTKGLFNIANNYEITSNSSTEATTQDWNITLTYINLPIDQTVNYGKGMEVKVKIQKEATKPALADHIKGLYTSQGAGGLYLHDSTLENGANDGSYRYAGANPNNYVCFGTDVSPCPVDNQYRIIGVFGDQVKLIKSDYATVAQLGTDGDYSMTYEEWGMNSTYKGQIDGNEIGVYYWNNDSYTNNWNESMLNTTNLNTNYINKLGTTWTNKIATTTWKVGGNTWANIGTATAPNAFKNEITTPAANTTYNAKIGLMYVSDYGFAADPSAWTTSLNNYETNSIPSKNWMYMGLYEWTISRRSDLTGYAFYVNYTGDVRNNGAVYDGSGVRPVFYLTSSTAYASGSGSSADPIVIN